MHLLVSKALLLCLAAHWIKFSVGFSTVKTAVGVAETRLALEEGSGDGIDIVTALIDGSVNTSCVENMKREFDENLENYVRNLGEDIHTDITLYMDHDKIHIDYGGHAYKKDGTENSTEVISVECTHPPSNIFPKYKTAEWNEIKAKVEISSSGSTALYITTSNTTMNCSYLIDHPHHHGNIVLHPVFYTLEFSPNGQKLLYLAETLPNPALDWVRFSPNLGGNWKYTVKKPQLFVVDILSREITMHPVPHGHVAGKSLWIPDSERIITVARPLRFNPCPECTDHPTRLVQIDTATGTVDYLSEPEDHVSFPVITPDNGHILFFKNKLHISHQLYNLSGIQREKSVPSSNNAPQSLVMECLEHKKVTVLIDEDFGTDGENGLYPHLVKPWANRIFLQDKNRFVISCFISNNMYVIDIESKEVLQVEDRTGVVLDVLDDTILSLHSSPDNGQQLRLGTLVETMVMTTSVATTEEPTTTEYATTEESTTKDTDLVVNDTTIPDDTEQMTTPQTALPLKTNETLPDPCQELIDSLLAEMKKEQEEDDVKQIEAALADTTTHGNYVHETTTEQGLAPDTTVAYDTTENHIYTHETTTLVTVDETTTEASTESPIIPLKGIKMETTNILTWHPVKSIHEHITIQTVPGGTAKIKTSIAERRRNGNLLVYIRGMDGKPMPLHSMYLWIAAGWRVMQVQYRGIPTLFKNEHSIIGSDLEKEVDDCHQAVIREITGWPYGSLSVLLMGAGMGGTIASNLATKHPDTYKHIILVNPVLSLPSLIVARPNYLKRMFNPDRAWFTPVDIAKTWEASPLRKVHQIRADVLMITTWDVLKTQAPIFDRKLRDHGFSSEYYQLEHKSENKINTLEMMVRWAEKHYQKYDEQCFVPAVPSTSTSPTIGKSSTSSTKEIKNESDKDMTTQPVSSSSKSIFPFIFIIFALGLNLLV